MQIHNLRMKKPTVAIILDQRRAKKSNLYPIKLRITFERKRQYYSTPFDLSVDDFDRVMNGKKKSEKDKILRSRLLDFENKARGVIDGMPQFNWEKFEKLYLSDRAAKDTIIGAFAQYAQELRAEGRIRTAVSYECSMRSIDKFYPNAKFLDVTPEFLKRYEKWMTDAGNSITTVGIYLRSLRTLFNILIAEGRLNKEYYPFGKRRYEIPTSVSRKIALPLDEIATIYHYKPEPNSTAARMKDYWLFSYLCNGINLKDLCLLRYRNIEGDSIVFERAKTARTKRVAEKIRVILTDELKEIIEKWGNKPSSKEEFLFPILSHGLTEERQMQLIQQANRLINDHMKSIAKDLGIDKPVTTYVARHSFATILKRSGASTEFIQEALGHSSIKTTASYLGSFEDETRRETVKALTAFKKSNEI